MLSGHGETWESMCHAYFPKFFTTPLGAEHSSLPRMAFGPAHGARRTRGNTQRSCCRHEKNWPPSTVPMTMERRQLASAMPRRAATIASPGLLHFFVLFLAVFVVVEGELGPADRFVEGRDGGLGEGVEIRFVAFKRERQQGAAVLDVRRIKLSA